MKIKKIKLKNFRGLIDEIIEFDSSMTVFSGQNGFGKSTVLEAVAIMLSWLPVRISSVSGWGKKITSRDITYGKSFSKLEMLIEGNKGEPMQLTLFKKCKDCPTIVQGKSDMKAADDFGDEMRVHLNSPEGANTEIPVFIFYGADRDRIGFCAPHPSSTSDRTRVYNKAFTAGTDIKSFATWFTKIIIERDNAFAELAHMPLKKANPLRDELQKKYAFLTTIKKALEFFSPTFKGFCIRDKKLFIEAKNCPAAYLSLGEKAIVALIADICLRMIVANPTMSNPLQTNAIILIDELDIHLHPQWQATLTQKLPIIFPNTQFIISTHSPSVIANAKTSYRLNTGQQYATFEKVENQYGKAPSDILASVMNATRQDAAANKIKELYSFIDDENIQEAQKLLNQLENEIPDDPEILRAEYLIRALSPKK